MNKGLIKHALFWVFFLTAFWGAFEMAYDTGCNPLWSAVWGFPIPHHYVIGFIGLALTYFLFTKDDWNLEGLIVEVLRDFDSEDFKNGWGDI